ncbi:MAG: hypothetical protein KGY40_02165 [Thioalkalivibrio sp.]|jgi:methyl-accepting chemotaxis protein|nr:hypothetical protein [Thioalkalivibrio sp.]
MSYFDEEKSVEEALERFDRIHSLHLEGAAALAQRLNFLYRVTFLGLALVLGGLFFLVMVISAQMSNMNRVISVVNDHIGEINQEMNQMHGTIARMDTNMRGMNDIVGRMDDIDGSVGNVAGDMVEVRQHMSTLDQDVERLSHHVHDMRESFRMMDGNMGMLANDVQHMSRPMQMFNQMNPFW